MGLLRGIGRGIGGLVALGIGALALVFVAALSIPLLIVLAVAGVIGAVLFTSAGVPTIVGALVALVAVGAIVVLLAGAIKLGVFALKVMLFALLLTWLARKVFGWWMPPRSKRVDLVGLPVVDVAPPTPRDKYVVAAERELDEELGL